MNDKFRNKFGTVLAVFAIVSGLVLLLNLPHHTYVGNVSRLSGVDYTDWEPWAGMVLLSAGISFFIFKFLPHDPIEPR